MPSNRKSNKPLTRLKQFEEQLKKMSGDDVAPRFETLQLHAGIHLQCHVRVFQS
jgi:hypothetical protein